MKIKSLFFNNVIILISGTAGAQLLTLLLMPLLTRIYLPAEYGKLGIYTSIVMVVSPVAAFSYQLAIVMQKENKDVSLIVKISILHTIITMIFSAVIIFVFFDIIESKIDDMKYNIYFIPITISIISMSLIYEQVRIRDGEYKIIAGANFLRAISIGITSIFLSYLSKSGMMLIISYIFGMLLQSMCLYKRCIIKDLIISKEKYLKVLKNYSDFAKFRTPQILLNSISQGFPIIIIGMLYGVEEVAYFTLAIGVLSMPVNLLSKSIGDVFYSEINKLNNTGGSLKKITLIITISLVFIGLIPFSILALYGESIFILVFGELWARAGIFGEVLTIWLYSMFISSSIVKTLIVINEQRFELVFTITKSFLRVFSIYLGYWLYETSINVIEFYSVTGCLINFVFMILIWKKIGAYEKGRISSISY